MAKDAVERWVAEQKKSGFGSRRGQTTKADIEKPVKVVEAGMPKGSVGAAKVASEVVKRVSRAPKPEPETYSESARGVMISAERAAREIQKHGLNPSDFFKEVGKKASYDAGRVMDWLGY